MIRIAIFADVHGKVLLPFKMVDLYQKHYSKKIDLILQCGDLGAFPDTLKMDKATIRHAKRDRQELGFSNSFVRTNPAIRDFLDKLDIDMISVRGNHEDHDFLDELENRAINNHYPIDAYHCVHVCKSGTYQSFQKGDDELIFMGVGRIGDRKNRDNKRFIQEYERENIKKSVAKREQIDVLITHDVSSDMTSPDFGMDELRPILDILKPACHFYGHTGKPYKMERDINNYTYDIKVKELEFNTSGILENGCMLILEKEYDEFELEVVERSFLNNFNKFNWEKL